MFFSLDLIHFIQQGRSPLLDAFFQYVNFFDTVVFFALVILLLIGIYGFKTGFRFFCLMFIGFVLTRYGKELFHMPRPFHIDPSVALRSAEGGGFPSGAAQTSMIVSIHLLYFWNSRFRWLVAILFVLLVSFSRLYLGVHFLGDLIGGWTIGAFLSLLYIKTYPWITQKLSSYKPWIVFLTAEVCILLIRLMGDNQAVKKMCLIAFAMTAAQCFVVIRERMYRKNYI